MNLTFDMLRLANVFRLPTFKNRHGRPAHSKPDGSNWSPAQWLEATVGELGEYANMHKKFVRGDITEAEFQEAARKELADVVIYLDLLAFQLKINLGQAVFDKFNEVSERVNSPVRLTESVPETPFERCPLWTMTFRPCETCSTTSSRKQPRN